MVGTMRVTVRALATVVALVSVGLGAGAAAAPASGPSSGGAGNYVVVLHDWVSNPGSVAAEHARAQGAQVRFVYEHAMRGYAATLSEQGLRGVQHDPRVDYVEADGVATIVHHRNGHSGGPGGGGDDPVQEEPTEDPSTDPCAGSTQAIDWGITKVGGGTSSTASGDCAGAVSNVNVYVIDTGVQTDHPDLNVVRHVNYAGGPNSDCNGHGTHVAGTIAARDNTSHVVGVAPGAPITGVKVLGCSGSGSWSGVIAGVDWVTKNARKPAIANMSLGGGAYQPLDDAVKKSADSGVVYSIAAGNSNANACNYSPARAGTHAGVVTVGATTSSDGKASFSNYGSCVDIWAPGVNILSTWTGGGTKEISGTSMAAPHVGGGAALYLSGQTAASASAVESALETAGENISLGKRLYVITF